MKNFYARLALWLIRPALDMKSVEVSLPSSSAIRSAATVPSGEPVWRLAADGKLELGRANQGT